MPKHSRLQIAWLESLSASQNIEIQHALSPLGEYYIEGIGHVDGYCAQTNTVYEFHGDYWHGNPKLFDQGALNKRVNKTFGELYSETLQRDEAIRALGYKLVTVWESEVNRKELLAASKRMKRDISLAWVKSDDLPLIQEALDLYKQKHGMPVGPNINVIRDLTSERVMSIARKVPSDSKQMNNIKALYRVTCSNGQGRTGEASVHATQIVREMEDVRKKEQDRIRMEHKEALDKVTSEMGKLKMKLEETNASMSKIKTVINKINLARLEAEELHTNVAADIAYITDDLSDKVKYLELIAKATDSGDLPPLHVSEAPQPRDHNNTARCFFDENYIKLDTPDKGNKAHRVKTSDLYNHYTRWCEGNTIPYLSSKAFHKETREFLVSIKSNGTYYEGLVSKSQTHQGQ